MVPAKLSNVAFPRLLWQCFSLTTDRGAVPSISVSLALRVFVLVLQVYEGSTIRVIEPVRPSSVTFVNVI